MYRFDRLMKLKFVMFNARHIRSRIDVGLSTRPNEIELIIWVIKNADDQSSRLAPGFAQIRTDGNVSEMLGQ